MRRSVSRMTAYSSVSSSAAAGTAPAASNSTPLCTSSVASPPSSRIMFGPARRPGQREHLLGAPPVLRQRLALPGEDRHALRVLGGAVRADGDGRGRGVLGGEDVAASPADLGAERDQGLDEDGGLHGHVQRAGDPGAGQRLARRRTRRAGPSGRASRARRGGSRAGRTRPGPRSATLKSRRQCRVMRGSLSSSRIIGSQNARGRGPPAADRPGAAPLGLRHHPRRNLVHGSNPAR